MNNLWNLKSIFVCIRNWCRGFMLFTSYIAMKQRKDQHVNNTLFFFVLENFLFIIYEV